ncbi:MAG: hypothetical protein J0H02_19665 [Armatimonadetes bacterium]|nr:hypothetical protein [Armatimonadota bacterium]
MLLVSRWVYRKHPDELTARQLKLIERDWIPLYLVEMERKNGNAEGGGDMGTNPFDCL